MSTNSFIEFRPSIKEDMIKGIPSALDTDVDGHARLAMVDPYATFFPLGDIDQTPIFAMRHANLDKFRFGSIFRPGDGVLSLQEAIHGEDLAQKDAIVNEKYEKISDDPIIYRISSVDPKCSITLFENSCIWKEGDFLDVKGIPFPFCIVDHADIFPTLSQFMQPCLYSGFLNGKPVIGMGNYDRIYLPQTGQDIGTDLAYILSYGHGIREDGRMETYLICLHLDGTNVGLYYIDGEEPFYTHDMRMEAVWKHLPYVNDGTCVYENAVFHIGNKKIHLNGKWGCKGYTYYPRYERHGQSELFGTWYEGNQEYKHKLYFNVCENMDAYDHNIKKLGFEIKG